MSCSRGRVAAAVAAALTLAPVVRAADSSADRAGEVMAARLEMQRQLGEWLTKSLQGAAEPYRVEAVVRAEVRGRVREIRSKLASASPAVKIGGKSKVKLPGLGMVDGGGGQAPLLPEINIEGGTRTTEQVSRQLETEVVKLTIMLFVDPVMPKDRREMLVKLAADLGGIDRARGDEVIVQERQLSPGAAGTVGGTATMIQATVQPAAKWAYEMLAMCATALLAAAILAWGLSRRAGAATSTTAVVTNGRGGDEEAKPGAGSAGEAAAAQSEAQRKRRTEIGAFKCLADATPKELVQVIAEADPYTAIAIVDLHGLDAEAAKLVEHVLQPQRRLEIGLGLATAKTLTRDQLGQMESVAEQILKRVRNRVPLGGPSRLAEFLSAAPAAIRQEVLDGVAARDESLAQAARAEMLLFEDLPRIVDASLRQVVSGLDPATVAVALVGAPEVREVVLAAVSERLRPIIESEEEVAATRPPEEIEKARRAVEDAMRAVQVRGELRTRAAPEPPAPEAAVA
jgi:flagellar motor switch protein FliG